MSSQSPSIPSAVPQSGYTLGGVVSINLLFCFLSTLQLLNFIFLYIFLYTFIFSNIVYVIILDFLPTSGVEKPGISWEGFLGASATVRGTGGS